MNWCLWLRVWSFTHSRRREWWAGRGRRTITEEGRRNQRRLVTSRDKALVCSSKSERPSIPLVALKGDSARLQYNIVPLGDSSRPTRIRCHAVRGPKRLCLCKSPPLCTRLLESKTSRCMWTERDKVLPPSRRDSESEGGQAASSRETNRSPVAAPYCATPRPVSQLSTRPEPPPSASDEQRRHPLLPRSIHSPRPVHSPRVSTASRLPCPYSKTAPAPLAEDPPPEKNCQIPSPPYLLGPQGTPTAGRGPALAKDRGQRGLNASRVWTFLGSGQNINSLSSESVHFAENEVLSTLTLGPGT